jgi:hypothetical protein
VTVYYRVLPEQRRRFAPYDGELYREVGRGVIPEYVLIENAGRPQRIPLSAFERVEQPELAPPTTG